MVAIIYKLTALVVGYILDLILGDPEKFPHPVKVFGNMIGSGEKWLNKGKYRFVKGACLTLVLVCFAFFPLFYLNRFLLMHNPTIWLTINILFVFWGLANKTLINEGKAVFAQLQKGIKEGRKQLSRIVGRDTAQLNEQQVKVAVLETMSENLSDGVIAPLFYFAIGGTPAMMAYKMINTLDSMIGYRNDRYEHFGKFAARLDDVANFIPARFTATLLALVAFSKRGFVYTFRYGALHKSPNSGYPEAALAGILDCRFGGPNVYGGKLVDKPYIGKNDRPIADKEINKVAGLNHAATLIFVILIIIIQLHHLW